LTSSGALIVKLSKNQFLTSGDGTTGVVLLLNELHKESLNLMNLGIDSCFISSTLIKYSKLLIEKLKSFQFSILKEKFPEENLLEFKIIPDDDLLLKLCFNVVNTKLNSEISTVNSLLL
jgi:chaperonin GroEL (HSP60 family)